LLISIASPEKQCRGEETMSKYQVQDMEAIKLLDPLTGNVLMNPTRLGVETLRREFPDAALINVTVDDDQVGACALQWDERPNSKVERRKVATKFLLLACLIEYHLHRGHVIVYCKNGRSRSPSALMAFFVLFRGFPLEHSVLPWFQEAYAKMRPATATVSKDFPNYNKYCESLKMIESLIQYDSEDFEWFYPGPDQKQSSYESHLLFPLDESLSCLRRCGRNLQIDFVGRIESVILRQVSCAYNVEVWNKLWDTLPDESFHPDAGRSEISQARITNTADPQPVTRAKRKECIDLAPQRQTKLKAVVKVEEGVEAEDVQLTASAPESAEIEPPRSTLPNAPVSDLGATEGLSANEIAMKESDITLKESIACHWWKTHLKPLKWELFTPKLEDWGFIPGGLLKEHDKKSILKFGEPGMHFAVGWDALYRLVCKYGVLRACSQSDESAKFKYYVESYKSPELLIAPSTTSQITFEPGQPGKMSETTGLAMLGDQEQDPTSSTSGADRRVAVPDAIRTRNENSAHPAATERNTAEAPCQNGANIESVPSAVATTRRVSVSPTSMNRQNVDSSNQATQVPTPPLWPPGVSAKAAEVQSLMDLCIVQERDAYLALYPPLNPAKDPVHRFAMNLVHNCMDKSNQVLKEIILGSLPAAKGKFIP
jgi:hypothetical protein